jgi:molecular chaperone GrpE (heat shock protein)
MEAPKKLYLDAESSIYRVAAGRIKDSNIEYIRADLVQELIDAAKALDQALDYLNEGEGNPTDLYGNVTVAHERLNTALSNLGGGR